MRAVSAVAPEGVLIKVGLSVLRCDPGMGAVIPSLEIRDCSVSTRHHRFSFTLALGLELRTWPMRVPPGSDLDVGRPAVGVDLRTSFDVIGDESDQSVAGGISEYLYPDPACGFAAELGSDDRSHGLAFLPPAPTAPLQTAELELIDLTTELGVLGVDHCPAESLQQHPCSLVAGKPQLAL